MSESIRVGIAGANWGRRHAAAFKEIAGVSLTAVADRDEEARTAMVNTFGIDNAYISYEEMMESGTLDAVVICLPTYRHQRATCSAFDAGLHVLCESPPGINQSEMSRIVSAAGFCGKTYMWARHQRFAPELQIARELIATGALGDVYRGEATGHRAWWPFDDDNWRGNKETGGGALLDLGIHLIDSIWFAMGCPDPMEAMASSHNLFLKERLSDPSEAAEDSIFGTARLKDGSSLSLSAMTFGHVDGPKGETEAPEQNSLHIFGTKASLDLIAATKTQSNQPDSLTESYATPIATGDLFVAQAQEFIDAIREEREPLNSGQEGLALMKLLDALAKSAKEKKSIPIKIARSLEDLFGGL